MLSNRCKDLFKRKKYFGVRCTLRKTWKLNFKCVFSPRLTIKHKYGNLPSYPDTTYILGVIDSAFIFLFLHSSLLRTRLHPLRMASVMITPSLFLSLICLVAVFSASDSNESGGCSGTANYLLSFHGLWKQDRHPNTALPSNAHFSPLVGCSHGSDYVMWRAGEKASAGVELVAERG